MKRKGFTLIELIVVIAILAVISLILSPQILGYIEGAKEAKDLSNCRNVVNEIKKYNAENDGDDISNTIITSFIKDTYGIDLLNVEIEENVLNQFMYQNEAQKYVYFADGSCQLSDDLPSLTSYDYSWIQQAIDDEMQQILADDNVPNDGRSLMNYLLDNDLLNILAPFEYNGNTYYTKADQKNGKTIFYAGNSTDVNNFTATHYRYNDQWYEFQYPINLATFDSWETLESGLNNNPPVVNYEVFTGTTIQINATPIDDFDEAYYNAIKKN